MREGLRTLRASIQELHAIFEEVPWDVQKFLELFGHDCSFVRLVFRRKFTILESRFSVESGITWRCERTFVGADESAIIVVRKPWSWDVFRLSNLGELSDKATF